jgi:hypothetical protein
MQDNSSHTPRQAGFYGCALSGRLSLTLGGAGVQHRTCPVLPAELLEDIGQDLSLPVCLSCISDSLQVSRQGRAELDDRGPIV